MAHIHIADRAVDATEALRSRRVLRLLVWILIPIAIWTVAALIWLWPHATASHIRTDNATVSAAGLTIPKGTVTDVVEMSCDGVTGSARGDKSVCAKLTVRLDEGPDKGQTTDVIVTSAVLSSGISNGTTVKLYRTPIEGQAAAYQFADFERTVPMVALVLVFAVCVILVARLRGLLSLVGLAFAGFIVVAFMLPALISGRDPVLVGLVGSIAIMFVALYTAHGFSVRTTTALVGTMFGLFISAGLGWGWTKWAHLSGVASEDDFMLAASAPDLRLTSVVICGIILAGLGVLNDVTVTQASAVWELADGHDSPRRLFAKAMRIGRDHIASSVYTIVFASAGAVLGVLLLITIYQRPIFATLLTEQFADELVRTLVGSIGLVLSVPATTALAVALVRSGANSDSDPDELGITAAPFNPDDELIDVDGDR